MNLQSDIYGLSTLPSDTVVARLSKEAEILIFGDTKHADPTVKGSIFGMLPSLKDAGFSKLWLEIDHRRQAGLDALLGAETTLEQTVEWASGIVKNNKQLYGEGIYHANTLSIEIGLIDDKRALNEFRRTNPRFVEIQKDFRNNRKQDMGIIEAEAAALADRSTDERTYYQAKKLEWQSVRDSLDEGFAARVLAAREKQAKQVVLVGDGHFNTRSDMDDVFDHAGVSNKTVHVYADLPSYGEYLSLYIDKVPDDGKERTLPDLIYFANMQKFAQPDHEHLMRTARKAYQMKSRGVDFNPPGYSSMPQQGQARS